MSSSNIFKVEDILSYPNSLIELFKEYQPHIFDLYRFVRFIKSVLYFHNVQNNRTE